MDSQAHVNAHEVQHSAGSRVEVCTDCHDGIKDEGRFDLAKYRPQVLH